MAVSFPAACRADNPVVQTRFTADPAPMIYKNTVYLYTGHDEDDATSFSMRDWLCYTSTDMANWTDHGAVASLKDFQWTDPKVSGWGGFDNGAWASQCIERDGKFYLYCAVQGRGIGCWDARPVPAVHRRERQPVQLRLVAVP